MSNTEVLAGIRRRNGVALLEVLVSIVILAGAGSAWVAMDHQITEAARQLRERERQMRAAETVLERTTLWNRHQLLAHLGKGSMRGFVLEIEPLGPHLWSISLSDSTSQVILSTVVYANDASASTSSR